MNRMRWTADEDARLRRLYPIYSAKACAAVLEREVSSIHKRANKLGLRKSEDFLSSEASGRFGYGQGVSTRFQKGQRPWNKGTRVVSGGRSAETRFKPGRRPEEAHNYRPIGSLRISSGVLERKITDDRSIVPALRWIPVHRLVWMEANGPVPEGHAIAFKAGMATTDLELITLDRLELVTRSELMRRNSYHTNYPPEVRDLIQLRGVLNRSIRKQERRSS